MSMMAAIFIFSHTMKQQIVRNGQQQIESAVTQQIVRDIHLLATKLSEDLSQPLFDFDMASIKKIIDELSDGNEIDYVYVFDAQKNIVHDGSTLLLLFAQPIAQMPKVELSPSNELVVKKIGKIIHVIEPIQVDGVPYGGIAFGLKFSQVEQDILHFKNKVAQGNDEFSNRLLQSLFVVLFFLIVLCLPLSLLLTRRLLKPMQDLANKSLAITHQRKDIEFNSDHDDEVGQLASALNSMTHRLRVSHQHMTAIAYQDELTKLANRRKFNEHLSDITLWAANHWGKYALLFIDLDKFKQINDSEGHKAGDILLQQIALRLKNTVEAHCDANNIDTQHLLLARLGGDEFVVVLPHCRNEHDASDLAMQLINVCSQPIELNHKWLVVSVSIGVTLYPIHSQDADELLKNADLAMYASKKQGRGRVSVFNYLMKEEFKLHHVVCSELHQALANDQLYVLYQPFYCTNKKCFIGAEALVRWRHPDYGLIMPDKFIEMLQGSNLINELTLWVVQQVCNDSKKMAEFNIPCLLTVNISSQSLMDNEVTHQIYRMLNEHRYPTQTIGLEITETGMMNDIMQCTKAMNLWRSAGAQIWIDDFGTGYSSLSYLNDLPIDVLKIDRSFVVDLSPHNLTPVVKSIFALAKALELLVVTEGIETELQASCCQKLGADMLQGFLYSKAVTFDDFFGQMALTDYIKIND